MESAYLFKGGTRSFLGSLMGERFFSLIQRGGSRIFLAPLAQHPIGWGSWTLKGGDQNFVHLVRWGAEFFHVHEGGHFFYHAQRGGQNKLMMARHK